VSLGKGLLRSLHPLVTVAAELHAGIRAVLGNALPDSFSLGSFEHQPWNQGQTETCWAHSAEHCVFTALCSSGRRPAGPFSPAKLSRCGYSLARGASTPVGSVFPKLADVGADDTTTFAALARYGLGALGQLGDGQYSDATPATVIQEPSLPDLETAMPILGPYAIDPSSSSVSDIVAAAIVAGHPVWVGAGCGNAEESYHDGDAPLDAPPSDAPGHATMLDGFVTVGGSRIFTKMGSWDVSYGTAGRCLVKPSWVSAAWWLRPVVVTAF